MLPIKWRRRRRQRKKGTKSNSQWRFEWQGRMVDCLVICITRFNARTHIDTQCSRTRISNQQATFSKWFPKNEITWHKLLNNNKQGAHRMPERGRGGGGVAWQRRKRRREEKRTEKSMRRKIKEENWKERVRATKSELAYTLLNYAQPCAVLCYGVVCAPITVFDADFFFRCLSIYIISTFFLCVCMVLLYMSLSTPVHFISPDLCINGSHICVFE